jgi:hypothetical protein
MLKGSMTFTLDGKPGERYVTFPQDRSTLGRQRKSRSNSCRFKFRRPARPLVAFKPNETVAVIGRWPIRAKGPPVS